MKLQIAFDSIKEFKDFLASVTEKEQEAVSVEAVAKAVTKKAATVKQKEAEPEKAEEEPKEAEPEKAAEEPKETELLDVQRAVKRLVKLGERDEARRILSEFNASKASELDPKDFNRAYDLLTEAADAAEAAHA